MSAPRPQRPIKNDYVARSGLPSASLIRPTNAAASGSSTVVVDPDAYLDKAEKEWNELVDVEVEGMANGLGELVKAFEVNSSTPITASTLSSLSLPLLSSSLLKNSTALLKLSQDLKILLLLNFPQSTSLDEPTKADVERDALKKEISALRAEVEGLLGSHQAGEEKN